jgi:FkbM family methyltransferase
VASLYRQIREWIRPRTRCLAFRALAATVGFTGAIECNIREWLGRLVRSQYTLHPRQVEHPLYLRPGSSDCDVLEQIFVEEEYSCLNDQTDVGLVVDCGANVGFSAAYFLSRFPTSRVISVEPDPGNFEQLRRNLAPYGDRVELIRSGVWSHPAKLVVVTGAYGDGREWTTQVRECRPGEAADVEAVDIGTILARSGCERISILKVDVEGAEAVIFKDNYQSWLPRVDALVIELHDKTSFGKASDVFFAAIKGQDFQLSESGELTVCKRTNSDR